MKKTTEELLKTLKHTQNFDTYLKKESDNITACSLSEYLNRLCAEKEMSPAQCIKDSGLDRTYAYQIFSGEKHPIRDKVLALCFGFSLTLEETQSLLKNTGYPPLYPRDGKDSLIIFALQHKLSLSDLNHLLLEKKYTVLH